MLALASTRTDLLPVFDGLDLLFVLDHDAGQRVRHLPYLFRMYAFTTYATVCPYD